MASRVHCGVRTVMTSFGDASTSHQKAAVPKNGGVALALEVSGYCPVCSTFGLQPFTLWRGALSFGCSLVTSGSGHVPRTYYPAVGNPGSGHVYLNELSLRGGYRWEWWGQVHPIPRIP